jgi:FkbM family methyltransferase
MFCPPILWNGTKYLYDIFFYNKRYRPTIEYYGLQELDKKLEEYLDYNNGFFIEIGGWDGISFSNTLYFEKFRNWRGILIEPAPNEFLKCKKNRPNAKVFCNACVPFGYREKFVAMKYCASMTVAIPDKSLDNDLPDIDSHVESGKQFLSSEQAVYEFGAIAKPLSVILDENYIDIRKIDLLVLDVEGFELNVLRGIDFKRHAPNFICVEVWNLNPIKEFLYQNGYHLLVQLSYQQNHQDYLFKHI